MKKLLILLIFLIRPQSSFASWALVDDVTAQSTDAQSVTTAAKDMSAADFCALYAVDGTGGFTHTVSDSSSLSWTALTESTVGFTGPRGQWYYHQGSNFTASHTFSLTGVAGNYPSIGVFCFTGSTTSPFDVGNGSGAQVAASTVQPGSITPNHNNELIVAGLANGDHDNRGTPVTIDSSMTVYSSPIATSNATAVSIAWKAQTSAVAINPTFSWPNAGRTSSSIASFQAGAGGGGNNPRLLLMGVN